MASPKQIEVKETLAQLRLLQKKHGSLVGKRIRMLIEIKKAGEAGISKRELAAITGSNHNSIQSWRSVYAKAGIKGLVVVKKKSPKPSILNAAEHLQVEALLNDSRNGLQGYVELNDWVKKQFGKEIKYNTLLKYCIRHFKSGVKVARKSHISKDVKAVELFKKTSVKSAGKQNSKKQEHSSKK